eukprot:jgi/Botrbrau1/22711/Bobra.0132s0050.1
MLAGRGVWSIYKSTLILGFVPHTLSLNRVLASGKFQQQAACNAQAFDDIKTVLGLSMSTLILGLKSFHLIHVVAVPIQGMHMEVVYVCMSA